MKPKYETYIKLVDSEFANGISAGIQRFIEGNKIDITPGIGSPSPVAAFTVAFMGEFANAPEIYPFKDSFKDICAATMVDVVKNAKELWANEEYANAEQLVRTIFYGETLLFLDSRADEAKAIIKLIRDTPVGNHSN